LRQAGHDVQQTLITELVNSSLEDKLWAVEKEKCKIRECQEDNNNE